ncbi:MAG TPA: ferredoxin--NADP reductase [Burkholderiaceae bacterium]|jgi:ferredoxin--NADP+ reductase|nr:ferredoxin--NADP reductase [Burkholderiaceae bacterium]
MGTCNEATVLSVRHWTERLFSFTTTRDPGFRFTSGQFVMLGLMVDGRPLMRAYSIASSAYESELEFFSIKVPDGALTSRLQHIRCGDKVLLGTKPTGTLLLDNLAPGRTLWLLATGTGLAPFLSIVRDIETYARFERVVLVHGVRRVRELAYADLLREELPRHPYLGEAVRSQLLYCPLVTREPFERSGRIPDLIERGALESGLGLPLLDPASDRCMLCGSAAMISDTRAVLEGVGFSEGHAGAPGSYVVERAFVDR